MTGNFNSGYKAGHRDGLSEGYSAGLKKGREDAHREIVDSLTVLLEVAREEAFVRAVKAFKDRQEVEDADSDSNHSSEE